MSSSSKRSPVKRRKPIKRSSSKRSSLNSYSRVKKYNSRNVKKRKTSRGSKKSKFLGREFNISKDKIRKTIYVLVGFGFFVGCVVLIIAGIYLKNLQGALPSPDELIDRSSDQSTQIFDRNGELLFTIHGDEKREFVPVEEIPEYTKWALVAAEDAEFYQHKGVDYMGILRSAIRIATNNGEIQGGGSTISQQLVKNTLLKDLLGEKAFEQDVSRKIKEILITMQLEQTFTKDEILQMYMNEIALGGVNYGFQAGANAYFGKDVQDLTLAESAVLVGIIPAPSYYSPLYGASAEEYKWRQEYVLDQMLKHKDLTGVTEEEIEAAKAEEMEFKSKRTDIKAPHFVFYVRDQLEQEYGAERVQRGGLKVTTSLDYTIQEIAEEELRKGIDKYGARYDVNNGAVMVMDPNSGEILAMVGSVDYFNIDDPKVDGKVNITTSERQVGSSAKPYTYLSAFSKGYGPWTEAPDIKMSFGNYKPTDWDKKYEGIGTIRKYLGRSRNLPAVYALQLAGIDALLQTTDKLGITTLKNKGDYGLALALGAGEMKLVEHTAAFGAFANEGEKFDTLSILKVEDAKGEVLSEVTEHVSKRVVDEKEIYLLNYILCDLGGHGDRIGQTYSRLNGKNLCFKTGTTNGPKDVTTVMYHKNLAVGVWAGNNDNSLITGAWGSSVPLPIAYSITSRLSDRYPVELFARPAGVLSTTVCKDTGATPAEGVVCDKEASVYIAGHAPQVDKRETVGICESNGLIAENFDAASKYGLLQEKIVLSTTLENKLQINDYYKALGDKYLKDVPESGSCPLPLGPNNSPVVDISSPTSNAKVKSDSSVLIQGNVRVLESVNQFTVLIDGNPIPDVVLGDSGYYDITYPVGSLSLGNHTLTVTALDNYMKSGTKSVVFEVVDASSDISVSMTSPSNGVSISFPVTLSASVANVDADRVVFTIVKSESSFSKVLTDNDGSNGWGVTWEQGSASSGSYQIYAQAFVGTDMYQSSPISVSF